MSTAEEVERAVNKFSRSVSFPIYIFFCCVADSALRRGKSLSEMGEKDELMDYYLLIKLLVFKCTHLL